MKTTRIFLGLALLCGTTFGAPAPTNATARASFAFGGPAPTITTTPTNGPTTITVHARMKDGKLPAGMKCIVVSMTGPVAPPPAVGSRREPELLNVIGTVGDWMVTNIPPGTCKVELQSTNHAQDLFGYQSLSIEAGTNYCVNFVLARGASFKGRVLDDATGKPIADIPIGNGVTVFSSGDTYTDTEGRYELPGIVSSLVIRLGWTTNDYVHPDIKMDAADEGSTVSVPDIRLKHGGWISGRVERPAEVGGNANAWITLEFQGSWPINSMSNYAQPHDDGTFRTDPLPPGTYTLHARWLQNPFVKDDSPQNLLALGSVSNINVIAGQDTTNVLIPTKLNVQANSTGGR
jgi:hypothetical protein